MSVIETTPPAQTDTVSLELELKHPPEKVWRALTDPKLLTQWLLPTVGFTLDRGASFKFNAPAQPGWDGIVNCRVIDVDAPRKLSYNWVVGDIDTVVTFTLEPTATGTRMSLVQTGFKESQKKNWGGARYGLRMMGGKLVELLETIP
jgi:uncharacterized protein YndB with AHSA1/START domain